MDPINLTSSRVDLLFKVVVGIRQIYIGKKQHVH